MPFNCRVYDCQTLFRTQLRQPFLKIISDYLNQFYVYCWSVLIWFFIITKENGRYCTLTYVIIRFFISLFFLLFLISSLFFLFFFDYNYLFLWFHSCLKLMHVYVFGRWVVTTTEQEKYMNCKPNLSYTFSNLHRYHPLFEYIRPKPVNNNTTADFPIVGIAKKI